MTIDVELESTPSAPARARGALGEIEGRISAERMRDVRLLVSELVTNSVKHARVGEDDSIILEVKVDDERVRIEVRDPGPGFEPPAAAPPDDADAGWGLFLVEQLADEWGVVKERQTVWFEIDSNKRGGGSASQSTAA
jgi:anti-sigma regulatory factor (Ser/Thr protein kinase)